MLTTPHPGILSGGFDSPVVWAIYVQDFWARAGCLHECTKLQQLLVESALARHDRVAAAQMLVDWRRVRGKHVRISKFVPGDHYYVCDAKFDSLELAKEHAISQGYFEFSLVEVSMRQTSTFRSGD